MSRSDPVKRTYKAEREFGCVVGGVLLLMGGWWLYRGKYHNVALGFVSVGGSLILLGLAFPRSLVYPNKGWRALGAVLSFFSTRVILGIVFFLIVTPLGFVKRRFGWDPLRRRGPSAQSYWAPYNERQQDKQHYERMY